jgi:hypothetical protein
MSIALKLWSLYVRATNRWPIIATIVPFIPVVALWSIVANSGMFPRAFFPAPVDVARTFVTLTYKGILPDLFREGQGVVAEGALDPSGVFRADTVLAKHDETYMPKEVADALKKQGHWKQGDEQKVGVGPQGRAQ